MYKLSHANKDKLIMAYEIAKECNKKPVIKIYRLMQSVTFNVKIGTIMFPIMKVNTGLTNEQIEERKNEMQFWLDRILKP